MAIKIGLGGAPPLTTAALRFMLAAGILLTISLVRRYRFPTDIRTLLQLGYPGLYMYGLSYALIYFGEQYIDSSLASVLFGSFPFFVALLSWLRYRKERLTPLAWIGMLIGFSGVVLISLDSLQVSGNLFLGTLLTVLGAFCAAFGIVIHKQLYSEKNIVVSACVQMIVGGLPLLLTAVAFENGSDLSWSLPTLGSIVYLAVFGTVVAFLGYYWLLSRTGAVTVSLIAFVTPLVAIVIGTLIGDEHMTALTIAGTVLILSGIVLVIRRPRSQVKTQPEPQSVRS